MAPLKVLVADDQPTVRALVAHVLENAGYEVLQACNGAEAIKLWEVERPPLVITDWIMPEMDGEALCRHIRRARVDPYTYVIMLTMRDEQEAVVGGLEAGADDYIKKPFDKPELLLRVRTGVRVINLEARLADKISELEEALGRVHTLEGILPTCAYCGRIRDENNNWHKLEDYIAQTTRAEFSHGYCPECAAKYVLPQLDRAQRVGSGSK